MMNNDKQEQGARVRHVPIEIESRDDDHSDRVRSGTDRRYHNQGSRVSPRANTHQHQYNDVGRYNTNTSPSNTTTNIDINYKPSGQHPSTSSPAYNSYDNNHQHSANENNRQQKQHKGESSDQYHLKKPTNRQGHRSPSPNNSDKLIHSPEPIPLPPPPETSDSNSNNQKPNDHEVGDQEKQSILSINLVKTELSTLLQEINRFNGTCSKSRDYLYLDEMLDRCMLKLDDIVCESSETKLCRKTAIQMVDKATDILKRKQQINLDIHDLSEKMSGTS